MADLFTVVGGLLAGLLVVGVILYPTIGGQLEWDNEAEGDSGDQNGDFGTEKL